MKRGEKIIKNVLDFLSSNQDIDEDKYVEIFKLIQPFVDKFDSEDLDIQTIAKLESLIGCELIIIPTKQQWRKLKLENIAKNYENNTQQD